MKQRKSTKKYVIEAGISDPLINQTHLYEMREQLRQAIQQLEQFKLSNQLEAQKRIIAEQQCQRLKQQNQQLRYEFDSIKKDLAKYSKKYSKIKDQKGCERCKSDQQFKQKVEKQRQIFIKERNVLKNEIAELKKTVNNVSHENEGASIGDRMKKQVNLKQRIIEDQKKIIRFLDDKLSIFELQKIQALNYVEQIDEKLHQLQMQNIILRGEGQRRDQKSLSRKNGSIKNLDRLQKSHSRMSRMSPARY